MPPSSPAGALLEPSLTGPATSPILSAQATFYSSFIGGPWAGLILGTVNLARLRLLRREALLLAAALLVCALHLAFSVVKDVRPELLAEVLGGPPPRWLARRLYNVFGIAVWGVFYLRLRRHHRAAALASGFAKPWVPALLAIAGGLALHVVLAASLITAWRAAP